jgi:hypothetical protein
MALLTGCGLNPLDGVDPARVTTSPTDSNTSGEQQRLATSIEQLRRERDELRHQTALPSGNLTSTPSKDPSATPPQSSAPSALTTSSESFSALSRRLGGSIGLAYAPVGLGHPAKSLGDLRVGVGWSTMKIPVAIATVKLAKDHPSQDTLRLMGLAITQSDNEAAMELWTRLGSGSAAAAQTQAVLREGGDTSTVVPAQRLRPGYTPFGQANWSLAAQATFAASLPCMANTGPVLELMGQITPSQRWGIGTLDRTVAFKGGWGPGTDGAYLVRQMAVVRLADDSRIGLSLAALPSDGRFDTGMSDLNAMARWVAADIRTGGASRC